MNGFQLQLEKYADLAVKVGVNIQKGQKLVINATLDAAELVRHIVKKAYEAGANDVIVNWTDDFITRTKYELAPDEAFQTYPPHRAEELEQLAKEGACFMSIVSSGPDLLKGIDPKRIGNFQKAAGKALMNYRQYVSSDRVSWTVIAAASDDWAKKVFPSSENAVEQLWGAIFKAARADQADPVQAWKEHDQLLHKKVDYLNEKRFQKLHYRAPGTDLTIELPKNHLWVGAGSVNANGIPFMANMPTEEVFTVPSKTGVNGYVSSTKPLSYGGNIIDEFTIIFKKGKIVDIKAKQGEEVLKHLIETDEGARYLGEVALVPHESPISQADILFYNTLFDENASNHLAIGNAYAFCIEGGKEMTQAELEKHGLNQSMTHVDFMIGSEKMDIDGITADGNVEAVFRNGNWATK